MSDSNIIPLNKPDAGDPLHTILKEGAQQLLAQAVEAEIASFLAKHNTEGSAEPEEIKGQHLAYFQSEEYSCFC